MKRIALLAAPVAVFSTAAMAQLFDTSQVKPPNSIVSGISDLNTVKEASVREIMGVDRSNTSCNVFAEAGDGTPVLWRKLDAGTNRMQIYATDTGLVLIGGNLSLLASVGVRVSSSDFVRGEIVSTRVANSACGEASGTTVAVVRLPLGARSALTNAELVMTTRRKYPLSFYKLRPCSTVVNLEAGVTPESVHCFTDLTFPMASVLVTLVPRPQLSGLTLGGSSGSTVTRQVTSTAPMELAMNLSGQNLDRFAAVRTIEGQGSRCCSRVDNPRFTRTAITGTFRWTSPQAGASSFGSMRAEGSLIRYPRNSGRPVIGAVRSVVDSAWAGNAGDPLRQMGSRSFRVNGVAPPSAPAASANIDGFDPGNLLYLPGGGTTTVGNGPGESQEVMTALNSEAWCSTTPQPAAGPDGTRTVAIGTTTLGPIRWGVVNRGSADYTGSITAELRLGSRVVDSLTFSGTLPANGKQEKTYNRPITSTRVARESLGSICYHLGLNTDTVSETAGYTIHVTSPGSNTESLRSLN